MLDRGQKHFPHPSSCVWVDGVPGATFPPEVGPPLQLCSCLLALKAHAYCSPGRWSSCDGNGEVRGAVVQGCWGASSTSFLTAVGVLVLLPAVGHIPAPARVGAAWGHGILGAAASCLPSSTGREGAVMQLGAAGGCEQEMAEAAQRCEVLNSAKHSVGGIRHVVEAPTAPISVHCSPGPRSALQPLIVPQLLAEAEASQDGAAWLGAALGECMKSSAGGGRPAVPSHIQPAYRGAKKSRTSLLS